MKEVNKGRMSRFPPSLISCVCTVLCCFLHVFLLFLPRIFSLSFHLMEGYNVEGECRDSEGHTWSQNSEWMKFATPFSLPPSNVPSRIAQVQFQHGPNLLHLHPSAFFPTSTPFLRRLPHSERELEEIGTQIPHTEFMRGKEILEVKQEEGARKVSEAPPKKRGRPRKEKTAVKEKPKKKVKATVIELEESDEEDTTPTKWKDYEVETLIAIRGEMDEEFARTTNKQHMEFLYFSGKTLNFLWRMLANVGRMMRP